LVSQLKVNEIIKQSGSSITIGESGDTFNIPAGVTMSGAATNTPSFEAFPSGNQSISVATFTKMTFATEKHDSDSAFDTSTSLFTVPSNQAGTYLFFGAVCWLNTSAWSGQYIMRLLAQRDGSDLSDNRGFGYHTGSEEGGTVQFIIDLQAGDTVQFQIYHNSGATRDTYESTGTNRFGGFKLI